MCDQPCSECRQCDMPNPDKIEKEKEMTNGYNDIDKEGEQAVSDMFDTDNTDTVTQIGEMAEGVCLEMDAVEKLYKEHSRRKEALDAAKEALNRALTEAGMESCKLECGLNPRAKVNRRIFKASGLDDDSLFDWLRTERVNVTQAKIKLAAWDTVDKLWPTCEKAIKFLSSHPAPTIALETLVNFFPTLLFIFEGVSQNLGDIIKETVHHGTLNSTMKDWEDQGNELPESTFQISVRPTITMGGKTAYLASKQL